MKKLFAEAIAKFLLGVVLVGLLIFLPAGTLRFFGGWLLMAILFVPMFCAGLVMLKKDPKLLRSRLGAKEKRREQGKLVKLSGLMFIAGFVVAGLDFRFGWVPLPSWVNWVAAVLFLIAYILYAEVLRENAYLSRTIEVQEKQKSGGHGPLRHGTPSYVQRNAPSVSVHAPGAGICSVLSLLPVLSCAHYQATERRGSVFGAGTSRICRL